jgi:hypothetical protein
MPLQVINKSDRERLNSFPESLSADDLKNYYGLSEVDKTEVQKQREAHNQLGFALQLGALRHLEFIPSNLTDPPAELLHFVADHLGVRSSLLHRYKRQATQSKHLQQIMR